MLMLTLIDICRTKLGPNTLKTMKLYFNIFTRKNNKCNQCV